MPRTPSATSPPRTQLLRALPTPPDRLLRMWNVAPRAGPMPVAELSGVDAAVLTTEFLPRLADAGVLVEVTGEPPDFRRSEAAPVVEVSATDGGDADWFDLGVSVSVDGEDIPFAPLFVALAAGEEHLLLPSGTWFDVRRPEFDRLRRLIDEARALQDADGQGLRISRYQAGLWDELVELGVVAEQSERWSRDVRALLDVDSVAPPSPPAGLEAELRPYQLEGYQWLSVLWDAGLGGVLADDMGLGKTLQTLALICRAKAAGELTAPVLVVAPTSVVSNWAREAERFAPGLVVRTIGATGRKLGMPLAEAVEGADLVVTSYTLLRLGEEHYGALPWSGLVLDEAQFVKNHQAKTYAAARRLPARFKLAITGTPVENNLMDLWAMLSIVAPGLFPSPQRFTEHYRTPIERGGDPEVLAALRRRIRPLMRRRTKEQVAAELPPKTEQVLEVVLNPKHRKVYDTHLQRERRKVLGLVDDLQKNRFTIFRSLTLLRQLALDAVAGRRGARRGAVEQGRRLPRAPAGGGRRGAPRAGVQLVHRFPGHGPEAAGRRGPALRLPRRAHPEPGAVHRRVPQRAGAGVPDQPQGRRVRAQPDRGRLRVRARPVVEPGGGGAGGRPRAPDRPGQGGDGLPAGRRRTPSRRRWWRCRRASATCSPGCWTTRPARCRAQLTAEDIRGLFA